MHLHTLLNLILVYQFSFGTSILILTFFVSLNLCTFTKYLSYAHILIIIEKPPYSDFIVFMTLRLDH